MRSSRAPFLVFGLLAPVSRSGRIGSVAPTTCGESGRKLLGTPGVVKSDP